MPFDAHKTRRVYPADLYQPLDQPHHIHIAVNCPNVGGPLCPDEHWEGTRPDPAHLHSHVEYDGSTGKWGITRMSDEERADLEQLWAYENERQAEAAQKAEARLKLLRDTAREDPAFAALLEQFGLEERP